MMREVIAIAALLFVTACNSNAICHEGELYADHDGDGVYAAQNDSSGPIKCVQPERAMIEVSQESDDARSYCEGDCRLHTEATQ